MTGGEKPLGQIGSGGFSKSCNMGGDVVYC